MSDKKDIEKAIGDKKDAEVYANSEGGKAYLKELKVRISSNVIKLSSVSTSDTSLIFNLLSEIKSDVRVYRHFRGLDESIQALEDALK